MHCNFYKLVQTQTLNLPPSHAYYLRLEFQSIGTLRLNTKDLEKVLWDLGPQLSVQ